VYGPVCPVVWEGEGREAFPYPDFKTLVNNKRFYHAAYCNHVGYNFQ
jgi:hypothetical protein